MSNFSNELALVAVVVVCWLVGRFLIRRNTAKRLRPVYDRQVDINARPLEAVQTEVAQRLTEAANWSRVFATQAVSMDGLDAGTKAFFSKYDSVADRADLVRIDIELVKDSPHTGYVTIGTCVDDGAILLEKATGKVFEVANGEEPGEGLQFTTVFHYVLFCMVSWEGAE